MRISYAFENGIYFLIEQCLVEQKQLETIRCSLDMKRQELANKLIVLETALDKINKGLPVSNNWLRGHGIFIL